MKSNLPGFHETNYDFKKLSKNGSVQILEKDRVDSSILSYEFSEGDKQYIVSLLEAYTDELRKYFKSKNPLEWNRWKGNACRQIAVFITPIIKYLFPETKVQIKDIIFKNTNRDVSYNHAFVVAKKDNEKLYLFDLERNPVNADIIALLETSDADFPHKGLYSYENEIFVKVASVITDEDLHNSISSTREFYTREYGKKVILNCLKSTKIKLQRNRTIKDKINELINYVEKEY